MRPGVSVRVPGTPHEPILEANRDTAIADLLASCRADGPARVAGIISGLQRRVTKQGSPWAIVTVEDLDELRHGFGFRDRKTDARAANPVPG